MYPNQRVSFVGKEGSTRKTVGQSQRVLLRVVRVQSIKSFTTIPVALHTHTPCYLLPRIPSTLPLSVPVPDQLIRLKVP